MEENFGSILKKTNRKKILQDENPKNFIYAKKSFFEKLESRNLIDCKTKYGTLGQFSKHVPEFFNLMLFIN